MDTPGMSSMVEKQSGGPKVCKTKGGRAVKSSKKGGNERNENEGVKCAFCGSTEDNERSFGKFIQKSGLTVHYFCLLFASALNQRGRSEKQGILGFLIDDIKKELKRGAKLKCCYCKKTGATIGCALPKCGKTFHLNCGKEHETLNQFFGSFCVFCSDHRPQQNFPDDSTSLSNINCSICLSSIEPRINFHILRASCCKSAWFHRICVQDMALNAGYFFKCPLCNNKDLYESEMLTQGIYIPEQDASWERDPDAFMDLLHRHDECNVPKCICPNGRKHDADGSRWEIILCAICGHQGCHVACAHLSFYKPYWECSLCQGILNNKNRTKQQTKTGKRKSSEIKATASKTAESSKAPCLKTTPDKPTLHLVERIWNCQLELLANFKLLESLSSSEEEGNASDLNTLASSASASSVSSVTDLKFVYISDSDNDVDVDAVLDSSCSSGSVSSSGDIDVETDPRLRLSPRDFPSPHGVSTSSTLKVLVQRLAPHEVPDSVSDGIIPKAEVELPESFPTTLGITEDPPAAEAEVHSDPPQIICYLMRYPLNRDRVSSVPNCSPIAPVEKNACRPSVATPNEPDENLDHVSPVMYDPIILAPEACNGHQLCNAFVVNESGTLGITCPELAGKLDAASIQLYPAQVHDPYSREVECNGFEESVQESGAILSHQLNLAVTHDQSIAVHSQNTADSNPDFASIRRDIDGLIGRLDEDIERGEYTEYSFVNMLEDKTNQLSENNTGITDAGQECFHLDIFKENHNCELTPSKAKKKRDESRGEKKRRKKRKLEGSPEECRRHKLKPKRSKIQRYLASMEVEPNQALAEMADEFENKLSVDELSQFRESVDASESLDKDKCFPSRASCSASHDSVREIDCGDQIVGPLDLSLK